MLPLDFACFKPDSATNVLGISHSFWLKPNLFVLLPLSPLLVDVAQIPRIVVLSPILQNVLYYKVIITHYWTNCVQTSLCFCICFLTDAF